MLKSCFKRFVINSTLLLFFFNMKIDNHIAQLLYRYQCVTVPGFGAFLTQILSAEVNQFNNTFLPPRKVISFNALLKNNDGLLANYIAESNKISYEMAVMLIENAVVDWKQTLANNKSIAIEKIGVLIANKNGNLVFEPAKDANFLTTSFGLSEFALGTIQRNAIASEKKLLVDVKSAPLEISYQPKSNFLKYAAAVTIGLGTFALIGNNIYNKKIATQNQLVQLEVQKEVHQKIQEATFVIPNPFEKSNVAIAESEMAFHIVAGKFRNLKNAERLTQKLSKLGYKPHVLGKDNDGLSQVIFGSYPSFGTAQKALDSIQKNENPEAWILIKKL